MIARMSARWVKGWLWMLRRRDGCRSAVGGGGMAVATGWRVILAGGVLAGLAATGSPARGQTSPAPVRTIHAEGLMAVGPSQLVLTKSGKLTVTDRTGLQVHYADEYNDWWTSQVGAPNRTPRQLQIAFDQDSGRWVAAACDEYHGEGSATGSLWIALSHGEDFLGDWTLFTFDETAMQGDEYEDLAYADYSTLQLGFGGGVVAVTVGLDDYDGRNEFWEEDDSGFAIAGLGDIRGGQGDAPLTARQLVVSHEEFPYEDGRPVPARTFGGASGLYFVALESEDPASYLISKMSFSFGSMRFSKDYASLELDSLSSDEGRVQAVQAGTTVRLVHRDEWAMPGLAGHELIPEHRQIRDVVFRGNRLWVVHEGWDESAAVVRAHWLCLNMSFWPWHVVQSGRIGGGGSGLSCLKPTLAVNANEDVLIGFTATGPHVFPSASYAFRQAGDTPGTMRAVRHFVEGSAAYVNEHAFYPGVTAWPGSSSTFSDPSDPSALWTEQTAMREGFRAGIVQVTGNVAPVLTEHPQNRTVAPGGTAGFSVAATGTTLQYQWFHEEAVVGGVQGPTLTVTGVNALKTGYYRCRVSNAGGVIWSNPALLKLTTGNPGVFSFVDAAGDDLTSQNWNEPSDTSVLPSFRTLTIRRRNGSDGRVRVAVNLQGRFAPPLPSATAGWDFTGIQTPSPSSLFFRGPGALVFQPGETEKSMRVVLRRDTMVESPAETMEATLRVDPALGAVTTTPQLAIALIDNDIGPSFAQALDSSLTFANEGSRWKPQRTVTSDGVDAVQSDVCAPGGEPPEFSASFPDVGTLVFRWRADGGPDDALQVWKRQTLTGSTMVSQIMGSSPWHTSAVPIGNTLFGSTQVVWRYQRSADSIQPLATGFLDEMRFYEGTGGVVEFERTAYTVDEGAGTLQVTLRRFGHSAEAGVVGVSLVDGTAVGGEDFRPLDLGLLSFAAGQTSRTVTFTILPDQLEEPMENFHARLSRQGTGVIDIGPVDETTISITSTPGETYQSWATTHFSSAQLANPSISGPTANPDGDALTNFLEYAFNGDPLVSSAAPLPQSSIEVIPDEPLQRFTLSFARRRHALDLVYTLQRSHDMNTWTDAATISPTETTHLASLVQMVSATGTPVETRVVRDTNPVGPGPPAWWRLKVGHP